MNDISTMKDILDYAAETYQGSPAIRYKKKKEILTKTYRELWEDSQAVSRALDAMGMLGSHVAVIGPTTYEWIVGYFGAANSGCVVVPLDAQLPAADVCELLNRADISVLICDELRRDVAAMAKEAVPGLKYIISMQNEEDTEEALSLHRLIEKHAGSFSCTLDPDKLCAILFTSGTTGKSKGVMLTHRNLTENAKNVVIDLAPGTVSMTLLPIHHAYCFTMDILKGLSLGLVICINDSIMHVSRNLKLFKPEIILLVPMVVESISKKLKESSGLLPKKMVAKAAFGGNLKIICSGGAFLPPEMVTVFAEYGITVLQGYGMTECSPVISTNMQGSSKFGSVGKLLANCQARVVDDELWVKGSSVMMGYYKMPQETKEALTEDGWLRTGDLGYVDEDGFVFLTGRKKNLIILKNGENVSPEELENALLHYDLIQEVLVREAESVIEAEIFPDYEYAKKKHIKDVPAKLQEIIDEYNTGLPAYKKIHSLKVRETEFEKTPSKKIKRF